MALIKMLFLLHSISFSLSGFDFTPENNEAFNKAFFKKQILWDIKKYIPELLENPLFQSELSLFVENEKKSLFLDSASSSVRIPKYFVRARVKKNKAFAFEFGFIFTKKPGSVWNSAGKIKNINLFSKKQLPSEACVKIQQKKTETLYFENNKATQICSRFSLYLSGHPLANFHVEENTNSGRKYFYLSPRILYPTMIKHGIPSLYFTLRKEWRLGISRFTDKKDYSIIYFP